MTSLKLEMFNHEVWQTVSNIPILNNAISIGPVLSNQYAEIKDCCLFVVFSCLFHSNNLWSHKTGGWAVLKSVLLVRD